MPLNKKSNCSECFQTITRNQSKLTLYMAKVFFYYVSFGEDGNAKLLKQFIAITFIPFVRWLLNTKKVLCSLSLSRIRKPNVFFFGEPKN